MNYFKSYGVVSCMNAIQFAQDLKLGHYMKIGQRYTFIVQVRLLPRPLAFLSRADTDDFSPLFCRFTARSSLAASPPRSSTGR